RTGRVLEASMKGQAVRLPIVARANHLQTHTIRQVREVPQITATVPRDQAFDVHGRGPDLIDAGAIVDPHRMERTRGVGGEGTVVPRREAEVIEARSQRHNASAAPRRVRTAPATTATTPTAATASPATAAGEPRLVSTPRRRLL